MEGTTSGQVAREYPVGTRFCIIGAGAAGLSSAEALRERGFSDIVILEQSDRAGGKCYSPTIDGRIYEYGAGVIASGNQPLLDLIHRYEIPIEQAHFGESLVTDAAGQSLPPKTLKQQWQLLREVCRYRALTRRYPETQRPGHHGVDPALAVPFAEFAKTHRITNLAEEFLLFLTAWGYDYPETVPAAYVMKYYSWATVWAFLRKQVYTVPQGMQHIWNTVAAEHDVRYTTNITGIRRANGTLTVEIADQEPLTADVLLIASPLDQALKYLDASTEETALFSKIQTTDYRTIVVRATGLPTDVGSGYIPENCTPSRSGHPLFWYRRYADTDVYTFYVLGSVAIEEVEMIEHVQSYITSLGGKVNRIEDTEKWHYFPHVDSTTFASGYYDALHSLQGTQNTYYIGELLNFSTVGFTVDYAQWLVNTCIQSAE